MREPYNITFNQYRNTVTMPYIEFVVGDYMTCPLSFKWMKNDLESFNHAGTKIYLVVQTPSGKSIDDRCTINDAEAGKSNILLKQDFVIEKGLHRAELQAIDVESGIVRMTSPSFSYNVRKSLQDSNTEVAKNTLTQLQEALLAASNIDVDAKVETHNTNVESHPSLVSQLNEIATHATKLVTQGGGVHGLEIEDGIFDPYIQFGNAADNTYSIRTGTFTKIGNAVYINIALRLSSKTTAVTSGTASIRGLPFIAKSPSISAVSVAYVTYTNEQIPTGAISNNSVNLSFLESAGGGVALDYSLVGNTAYFKASFVYTI